LKTPVIIAGVFCIYNLLNLIIMSYTKQTWLNGPDGNTPVDADRLNHMEDGIATAAVREVLILNVGGSVPAGTPANTLVIQKNS
jgi:hypothetical protein